MTLVQDQFEPADPAPPGGQQDGQDRQAHRLVAQRGGPGEGPVVAPDDRGEVEDPDHQAAGHPEQLAQADLGRVAAMEQDRADHRQAARHGVEAGQQLVGRPGQPASGEQGSRARAEGQAEQQGGAQRGGAEDGGRRRGLRPGLVGWPSLVDSGSRDVGRDPANPDRPARRSSGSSTARRPDFGDNPTGRGPDRRSWTVSPGRRRRLGRHRRGRSRAARRLRAGLVGIRPPGGVDDEGVDRLDPSGRRTT